jgi:hypothetical protein
MKRGYFVNMVRVYQQIRNVENTLPVYARDLTKPPM